MLTEKSWHLFFYKFVYNNFVECYDKWQGNKFKGV